MITEDYVSFETAELLKEKGFDEPCLSYFWTEGNGTNVSYCEIPFTNKQLYSGQTLRPTLQMATKWLRDTYDKSIEPCSHGLKSNGVGWTACIYNLKNQDEEYHSPLFQSYEVAVETAIKYCLKKLI